MNIHYKSHQMKDGNSDKKKKHILNISVYLIQLNQKTFNKTAMSVISFSPFVTALPPNKANDLYPDTISSDDDDLTLIYSTNERPLICSTKESSTFSIYRSFLSFILKRSCIWEFSIGMYGMTSLIILAIFELPMKSVSAFRAARRIANCGILSLSP